MVKLGEKVTDRISGFCGIATGRAEYLYGCVQIHVAGSKLKDGEPVGCWFDEGRLDVTVSPKGRNGGPQSPPPERSHPR